MTRIFAFNMKYGSIREHNTLDPQIRDRMVDNQRGLRSLVIRKEGKDEITRGDIMSRLPFKI